jgi:hypothetical protein
VMQPSTTAPPTPVQALPGACTGMSVSFKPGTAIAHQPEAAVRSAASAADCPAPTGQPPPPGPPLLGREAVACQLFHGRVICWRVLSLSPAKPGSCCSIYGDRLTGSISDSQCGQSRAGWY